MKKTRTEEEERDGLRRHLLTCTGLHMCSLATLAAAAQQNHAAAQQKPGQQKQCYFSFCLNVATIGVLYALVARQWCWGHLTQRLPTMAQANTKTALKATAAAPAPVAVTAPMQAMPAPVAPAAPLFTFGPYNPATSTGWPLKAQGGASIRAYCAKVAQALAKAQPGGFTVAQYASALASAQAGTTYKLPASGFGNAATGAPNATARQHATWFANTGRYLVPVQG